MMVISKTLLRMDLWVSFPCTLKSLGTDIHSCWRLFVFTLMRRAPVIKLTLRAIVNIQTAYVPKRKRTLRTSKQRTLFATMTLFNTIWYYRTLFMHSMITSIYTHHLETCTFLNVSPPTSERRSCLECDIVISRIVLQLSDTVYGAWIRQKIIRKVVYILSISGINILIITTTEWILIM